MIQVFNTPVLPSVAQLSNHSIYGYTLWHGFVLHLLILKSDEGSSRYNKYNAIKIFVEKSSLADWKLRRNWICCIKERCNDAAIVYYLNFAETLLKDIFENSFIRHLYDNVPSFLPLILTKEHLPNDVFASIGVEKVARALIVTRCSSSSNNRKVILLQFIQNRLHELYDFQCGWKDHKMSHSLLSSSKLANEGKISVIDLPHPVVVHIEPLFRNFDNCFLAAICDECLTLSDDNAMELLDCLNWRCRLYQECQLPIENFKIETLSLLWKWFKGKCIKRLAFTYSILSRTLEGSQLLIVVEKLDNFLNYNNRKLLKVACSKIFRKKMAYKTKTLLELNVRMLHIDKILKLYRQDISMDLLKIARLLALRFNIQSDYDFRQLFLNMTASIMFFDNENISDCTVDGNLDITVAFNEIEDVIQKTKAGNLLFSSNIANIELSDLQKSLSDITSKVHYFAPVFENYVILHQQDILNTILAFCYNINRQEMNWQGVLQELQQHVEFGLRYTMQSPKYLAPFQYIINESINEAKYDLIEMTIPQLLFDCMNYYWNFTGCEGALNWQNLLYDTENDVNSELEGPRELFCGNVISNSMFGIISQDAVVGSKNYNVAQIGLIEEKLAQLKTMSSFLWYNVEEIASSYTNAWLSVYNTLCLMTSRALLAYRAIFTTEIPNLEVVCNNFIYNCLAVNETKDTEFLKILIAVIAKTELEDSFSVTYGNSFLLVKNLLMELLADLRLTIESRLLNSRTSSTLYELFHLGAAWVRLGLLFSILASPTDPVDPLIKHSTKLSFLQNELQQTESEIKVRRISYNLLTGFNWNISNSELLDADIPYFLSSHEVNLIKRQYFLGKSIKQLETKAAYRPSPSQYDKLIDDINNVQHSLMLPDNILQLLQSLKMENFNKINPKEDEASLAKEIAWQKSMLGFISSLQANYPAYMDVYMPFSIAMSFIRFGLRLAATPSVNIHRVYQLFRSSSWADIDYGEIYSTCDSLLRKLIAYPADDNARTIAYLLDSKVSSVFKKIVESCSPQKTNDLKGQLSNILLLLAYSMVIENNAIASVDFGSILMSIFEYYHMIWKDNQIKQELKEEERHSLFKYKVQEHLTENDNLDDDEEIKLLFPTYNDEFEPARENAIIKESTVSKFDLQDADIRELVSLHTEIFGILSTTKKISDDHILRYSDEVYKKLFQRKYVLASSIKKLLKVNVNADLDSALIGSHLLMNKFLIDELTSIDVNLSDKDLPLPGYRDNIYDFYQDANVSEAQRLPTVMNNFLSRLNELLIEWPDHPILCELQICIRRILSFSTSNPLMKYLTGLEFILKKAQDWENYASKAVSIYQHLDEITNLIVRWRSLELKSWSNLLDLVRHNFKNNANRWWFHIYDLYSQFTKSNDNSRECNVSEIIRTLSRFIENSNIGEFSARLMLLRSFYHQLTYEKYFIHKDDSRFIGIQQLHCIFCNMYQYYAQFLCAVEDKIKSLRAPIDKELQDFVKISKWNDFNYWSLKDGIARTHHTLHKYIKKFRECLSESVGPILIFTSRSLHGGLSEDSWNYSSVSEFYTLEKEDARSTDSEIDMVDLTPFFENTMIQSSFANDTTTTKRTNMLPRISSITHKFRMIINNETKSRDHTPLISRLNDFCTSIIETIKELQNDTARLDVKKVADVKLLGTRKRRSLAMLFSSLSCIGLSYRKGLRYDTDNKMQESALSCKSIDECIMKPWNTILRKEVTSTFSISWSKCTTYFYKCCSHYNALISALNSPSADLTYDDIERCHGFGSVTLRTIIMQKEKISLLANKLTQLGTLGERISKIIPRFNSTADTDQTNLPPQMQSMTWINRVKKLSNRTVKSLLEMRLLLEGCPMTQLESVPTPWKTNRLPIISQAIASDTQVLEFIQKINAARKELIKHMTTIDSSDRISDYACIPFVSWLQIDSVAVLCDKLQKICEIISDLEKAFRSNLDNKQQPSKFMEPFTQLRLNISRTCHEFYTWQINLNTQDAAINVDLIQNYMREANTAVTHILYVAQILSESSGIQNSYNQARSDINLPGENDENIEELQPQLLSATESNILDILDKLHLQKVINSYSTTLTLLSQLHDASYDDPGQKLLRFCCKIMTNIKPLFLDYVSLTESYFWQYLLLHRTCCKLSYILMNTFIELMTKVFNTEVKLL